MKEQKKKEKTIISQPELGTVMAARPESNPKTPRKEICHSQINQQMKYECFKARHWKQELSSLELRALAEPSI